MKISPNGGIPGAGAARRPRPILPMTRRHAAVVRRPRPVVERRLRPVHRRPAARGPVHRRAGRPVGRRLVVGGDAAAAARAAGAHHRYARAVHRDGLALGVQLHAGRRFSRVLKSK
jgi:hypothetical protein